MVSEVFDPGKEEVYFSRQLLAPNFSKTNTGSDNVNFRKLANNLKSE